LIRATSLIRIHSFFINPFFLKKKKKSTKKARDKRKSKDKRKRKEKEKKKKKKRKKRFCFDMLTTSSFG
jgi:hypothetical protein